MSESYDHHDGYMDGWAAEEAQQAAPTDEATLLTRQLVSPLKDRQADYDAGFEAGRRDCRR